MLLTFPFYQLYLQIFRHHRHKKPQTQLQQVSDVKGWSLSSVAMGLIAVADPDLQIREGGGGWGYPDPEIMGGGLKFSFRPFRPQFGPKVTGSPGPPVPLPWIRL